MIKVIKNGTVITMNKNNDIKKLDIVIKDSEIIDLVSNYNGDANEIIDATNMIVMPGLINTHAHLGMSIFRGTNDGLDLMNWLNNKIFPIEDKMTEEDMFYSSLLSSIEAIKTGTTCISDMYFKWNSVIKALEKTKIRCLFSRCINDSDGDYKKRIKEFEELISYSSNHKNELITLAVTPHSLYTCSKECLVECKKLADKYNLPIHIHFCENKNEVHTIENKFGMKPIKVLEDLGYLNNKLILAHGVYLEEENLHLLSKDNIFIAHNIISNLNLGCGILPYKKYKENGINISLGTDGQGSGLNLDMFNTMAFTSLVTKGLNEDPLYTDSYEILKSATINGAKALGLDDKIGSIEVNKKADIIVLDLNNIEIYPTNNLISQIVHNVKANNVIHSIINGNIIMKNREILLDINEEQLKNKIIEITKKLELNK